MQSFTSFLFWNVGGKYRQATVARLATTHRVDFVALAECPNAATYLAALNAVGLGFYALATNSRVAAFCRTPDHVIPRVRETAKSSVRVWEREGDKLLVAVAHLPSGVSMSRESRNVEVQRFADSIREAERATATRNTLVLGDLNLNPFESAVAHTVGFHAVSSRDVARKRSRVVQEAEYDFFYNPMWRFLGGGRPNDVPPRRAGGTYYYWKAEHDIYFWNVYDQVLIRPELLDRVRDEDVSVPETDGAVSLVGAEGRPNPDVGSDHLPVAVRVRNVQGVGNA